MLIYLLGLFITLGFLCLIEQKVYLLNKLDRIELGLCLMMGSICWPLILTGIIVLSIGACIVFLVYLPFDFIATWLIKSRKT